MKMLIGLVLIVVITFIAGCVEALTKKQDPKDRDSDPEIMIGWKVPGPFDAFKKDK